MKKGFMLLFGILAFFFVAGSAMAYEQDWFMSNQSSASFVSIYGAVNVTGNQSAGAFCNTTFDMYADINSSSPYSYQFAFYIDGVLNYTNTQTSSMPRTCLPLGSRIKDGGFYNFTASATALGSAIPIVLYVAVNTTCFSNNSFIYLTGDNDANSKGWNMYESTTDYVLDYPPNVTHNWDYPATCSIRNNMFTPQNLTGMYAGISKAFYVPFNSGSGNIIQLEYKFTTWNGGTSNSRWFGGYYDISNNITTQLFWRESPSITYTEQWNLSLTPNHNYVAWLQYFCGGIGNSSCADHPVPDINVSLLDYEPNYVCGSFGNCTNGTQTRTCSDLGGISPDIVQTISCLPVNQTIYLGFEDSLPTTRDRCTKTVYPFCFDSLENMTAYFPINPTWSIFPPPYNPQYTATITGETASRGFKSLKLWTIPPSPPLQPTFNNGTRVCGNISSGEIPVVSLGGLNATFLIQYNFTFPSSTMHLLFDVKKCSTPVVQYDGWCGKSCYGYVGNCSIEPLGDYSIFLYDNDLSTEVLGYISQSKNNWTTIDIDLTGSPNIIDHTYTISMAVGTYPLDFFAPYGWCSYFDNVRFFNSQTSTLEQKCLDLYGLPCSSLTPEQLQNAKNRVCPANQYCVGNDLYISNIQNDICVSQMSPNDSGCVAQTQSQIITGNQSLFLPIGSICNQIVNTTTNQTYCEATKESGFGFSLVFLTPIFWLMGLIIIVMTGVTWISRHMEVGLGAGILLLIGFTMVFPELLFITIAITVIVGFIVGRSVVRAVVGGS
jgi:hypothetical protein